MNKYFIPNQTKSSFTLNRKYMIDLVNYVAESKNKGITDETKRIPILTIDSVPTRTDLVQFVKEFNKVNKKSYKKTKRK